MRCPTYIGLAHDHEKALTDHFVRYAKTAKKVDMKRIKSATWKILTQASSEVCY